jgi:hypothetical protein
MPGAARGTAGPADGRAGDVAARSGRCRSFAGRAPLLRLVRSASTPPIQRTRRPSGRDDSTLARPASTRTTCDVRLEDPHDFPRSAHHLQRHPVRRQQTRRQRLQRLERGIHLPTERTCPLSHTATSQNSKCTSRPIARPAELTTTSPLNAITAGEPAGKRHGRIRARSATGQVAGAAIESTGSQPTAQNGLPKLRSPTRPLSQ